MQKAQDLCLEVQKLPVGIWEQGIILPLLLFFLILSCFRLSPPTHTRLPLSKSQFPCVPGMGELQVLFHPLQTHGAAVSQSIIPTFPQRSQALQSSPSSPSPLKVASNHNKTCIYPL